MNQNTILIIISTFDSIDFSVYWFSSLLVFQFPGFILDIFTEIISSHLYNIFGYNILYKF
jgi:hypothetical protein